NSKLAQMMIDVQIAPAPPVSLRHFVKQRMPAPLKVSLRLTESLNHRCQFLQVATEFDQRRAAAILIHLRASRHATRPNGLGGRERSTSPGFVTRHCSLN